MSSTSSGSPSASIELTKPQNLSLIAGALRVARRWVKPRAYGQITSPTGNAMSGYEVFSATPGSNSNIDGASTTDIAENNLPKTINNAMRALVAEFAKLRDLIGGAKVTGGTANAQTLATGLSLSAYQQGILIGFEAGATNTGAITISIDSVGAKSVKLVDGSNPSAGAITAGGIYLVAYESNADVLLLLNPTPGAGSLANVVEDTTPQLGGDLDLNGYAIDFPSTPNISDALDEDTMSSNSATALATQQSIKAYVDASVASTESVQDIVGAMVAGNTESGLSVTYQDADGTLDFAVDGVLQDLDTLGANSADGEFLVGTGAGVLAWENGATLRASIGLGTGDSVQFGDTTVTAFTSNGIDDNATGERVQIGNGNIALGDGATAGETYGIQLRSIADGYLWLSGATGATTGANMRLYGSTHASQADDIEIRASGTKILQWDESAGQWKFSNGNVDLGASTSLGFAGTAILSDAAGTMTLANIDALDSTTEATIEAAIDTLANLTAAAALTTVGTLVTGNADAIVSAASSTAAGKVELATVAELDAGTDAGRVITPDVLAGSDFGKRVVEVVLFSPTTDCAVGNGAAYLRMPAIYAGWNFIDVEAVCVTAGTTGTMDIQIHNLTQAADILSTKITIDSAETDSSTAATAPVISGSEDDIIAGDMLRFDVDAIHTTAAKGLIVEMTIGMP